MKTIISKSPHESSFSFSRRYFHLKIKDNDQHQILTANHPTPKHKHGIVSLSKLLSAIASLGKARSNRVVGTIFGHRRGHVHFSVQVEGNSKPTFLIKVLAMRTTALVREMASGAARIALECDKSSKKGLQEEGIWRAYCNGKKYGVANRYECGDEEWRLLKAVGPITVGAGVLPAAHYKQEEQEEEEEGSEEVMFMRANFERVVASTDSEAFYMINPHVLGGPELTIFLLRL